mgnify:CR=1 FL=1
MVGWLVVTTNRAEPNERIEGMTRSFREMGDILDYVGFSPTQILLASVLELSSQRSALGEELYANLNEKLANILEYLTLHGARIFPEVPPSQRPGDRPKYAEKGNGAEPDSTRRDEVKLQGNVESNT